MNVLYRKLCNMVAIQTSVYICKIFIRKDMIGFYGLVIEVNTIHFVQVIIFL